MLSREAAQKRLDEIKTEFMTKTADYASGRLVDKSYFSKWCDRANAEVDDLQSTLKQHAQIAKYAGAGDGNMADQFPRPAALTKSINGTPTQPWSAAGQSPMQLSDTQTKALIQAAVNRTPCRIEVGKKGMESAWIKTLLPNLLGG